MEGELELISEIVKLMIQYNKKDVRRINHALKVFSFAQQIGKEENCDFETQNIIEYSSILHDIGIHEVERKYHSSAGNYQEKKVL